MPSRFPYTPIIAPGAKLPGSHAGKPGQAAPQWPGAELGIEYGVYGDLIIIYQNHILSEGDDIPSRALGMRVHSLNTDFGVKGAIGRCRDCSPKVGQGWGWP